jgi:ferredoxin-NADP reductase
MHLVYSARTAGDLIYRDELEVLAGPRRAVTLALTRESPPGWTRHLGRVDAGLLAEVGWPPSVQPHCYVCGPTPFVEAVANALVGLGHEPGRFRTQRHDPGSAAHQQHRGRVGAIPVTTRAVSGTVSATVATSQRTDARSVTPVALLTPRVAVVVVADALTEAGSSSSLRIVSIETPCQRV